MKEPKHKAFYIGNMNNYSATQWDIILEISPKLIFHFEGRETLGYQRSSADAFYLYFGQWKDVSEIEQEKYCPPKPDTKAWQIYELLARFIKEREMSNDELRKTIKTFLEEMK